jgi:phosphatidylserine/phosphatidylglycerophosphate/cardiolipin synthase-like enzyme
VRSELIQRLDRRAGQAVESAIRDHHRRRLRRLGRSEQLDPPEADDLWCAGTPPPRDGCELRILIDGAEALPAVAEAVSTARSHVHIAGWHLRSDFGLTRNPWAKRLRDLLGELAERVEVRVLLWAGAPLPIFSPDRREVQRITRELTRGTSVRCAFDARERPMHCHHEKLVVVDGQLAFVGGIDLTSLGGDRYDSADHPARPGIGWHDVGSCLRGPAVADVAEHFGARWREVTGEDTAPPAAHLDGGGSHEVQVVRTVPERIYDFAPRGDFRILEAYRRALRSACKLIYLESQFLWSTQVVDILAEKLREPPADDFRLLVLLPARPNNGADSTRGQLGVLAEADADAHRFLAATVTSRTGGLSSPLYVHAKVGIVDDRWLTVGSANLNDHSLFNDTEVNVVTCDPSLARDTRLRLWAEHLERPREQIDGDPTVVIDELWRPIAREQLQRRQKGEAATHRLLELPGVSRRSMALLGPVDGLFVDG